MAAEGHADSGSYVLHHLTNLKLDLHTMALDPEAKGFWVLNLDSVIFSLVLGSVFLLILLRAASAAKAGKGGGLLNFVEMLLEFWTKQVKEVFPHANPLVVPLALTIFVWVLFMNLMDIVPVDLLPFVAGHAGLDHLRIVPSTDVNITFGLSLGVFLLILAYNIVFKGPVGFIKEVLTFPFGPWLAPVNLVLRIVEEIARPVSLALRLFGNLFAGELIFVLIALLLAQARNGVGGAALATLGFGADLAWAFFHLLVIPLQAFVFAVLTVVYLSTAAESHGDH
jgi:F-type H+-transporting ATPase subunit a